MKAMLVALATCSWIATGAGAARAASAAPGFESRWQDGRAEVDAYRLTIGRYGHPRTGRAVLIYVTEPFSDSSHVKLDDPSRHPADAFEALKLNLVRRFQTGIYDYETMVSLFTRSADFSAVKVAFTSAEWCGQVYEELNFRPGRLDSKVFSYFEGESGTTSLPMPKHGVEEDQLFILLRGLRGEFLAAGGRSSVPFLASPFYRRLTHSALSGWANATIERSPAGETTRVPAGTFATTRYVVKPADGRRGTFWIERDDPHRVIRWDWAPPPGATSGAAAFLGGTDAGELTGSSRMSYWKLHDPGDEKFLDSLGLEPAVR